MKNRDLSTAPEKFPNWKIAIHADRQHMRQFRCGYVTGHLPGPDLILQFFVIIILIIETIRVEGQN